jgi:hypothetical protein
MGFSSAENRASAIAKPGTFARIALSGAVRFNR